MRKILVSVITAMALFALSGCSPSSSPVQTSAAESTATTVETEESEAAEENVVEESQEAVAEIEGTFKMAVFNYDSKSYPDIEVWVRGAGSWYPNADFGDTKSGFGPFAIGEELRGDFYIYPFGRDGVEVPVTLLLQDDHISESDRDQVWIWIEDGVLVVTGTPILEDIELPLN